MCGAPYTGYGQAMFIGGGVVLVVLIIVVVILLLR